MTFSSLHADMGDRPLSVSYVPLETLRLNPKNPRHHSLAQIRQIARSMRNFGFNVPILVDASRQIVAGHGRYEAGKLLGLATLPVILLEHLTEQQAKAFLIADNRLTDNSSWDDKLLATVFMEISQEALDFDLEAIGFSLDEIEMRIDGLGAEVDRPDPADKVHALSETSAISQAGDLWQMGAHRLLCGDATRPEDFARLMEGLHAAMAFTDPPYNVNYAASAKDKMRGTFRPIINDDLGAGFGSFLEAACRRIVEATDGGIYICMSSSELHALQRAFVQAGGHWSTFIIWAKQTFTLGRADYQRQYEPILYGWREGAERFWCGARDQGDVWNFDKPVKNDLHPTMKPVELVMRAIRNSCERGTIVLDPFLGSGSTLIAAERTGRVCYGIELDPRYIDVIVRRWQSFTGEQAVHAETGLRFEEVVREREADGYDEK